MLVVPAVGVTTITEAQSRPVSPEEWGARLEAQLIAIGKYESVASDGPKFTLMPEHQINAFLRFQGADRLPNGISDARVEIGRDSLLTVEAILDLDLIRNSRPRHWLDPIRYLGGRLAVSARGRAQSGAGVASLEVESVAVGGIAMPVRVLEEIIRYYTRRQQHLQEWDSTGPIHLPYGIHEIRLSPGLAVVVQ